MAKASAKKKASENVSNVENVEQTLTVPASFFLNEIPEPNRVAIGTYLTAVSSDEKQSEDVMESLKVAMMEGLQDESVKMLESLGAKLPSDMIDITMSLGSLLFDLWIESSEKPSAPIKVALYNKKNMEYAALLSAKGDDFAIPKDVLAAAKVVASDDEAWAKSQAMITIGNGATLQVTSKGAEMFGEVLTKLVEIAS